MGMPTQEELQNPPSVYRGKPFWAWNAALEPGELRRQIRIMEQMGLGGFFMHSRVGLNTEYLGADWFRCVDACVEEAKARGMEAWLYDEDRWPSGAAGSLVTKDPAYRQRHLYFTLLHTTAALTSSEDQIARFAAVVDGRTARGVRRLPLKGRPTLRAGESLLVFGIHLAQDNPWYNNAAYLDTLNPEAVARFIEITHEAYRARCGGDFGGVVPGIFTDEPNFGPKGGGHIPWGAALPGVYLWPWTDAFPAVFRERYGYDILDHLPEVMLDVEDVVGVRARIDYHDCVTQMFVDAFSKQIGAWCDAHGLLHTGHLLAEDTLRAQTNVVGSCMRFYESMQAPGMDLLTEHSRHYPTAKQVSSAARQFGRTWRLTETYGCTGWDFPFLGQKALGDWQVALGINLRAQHLSWYSMLGQAKRDYPASMSFQSPWWPHYRKVEDYFARIHAVMTRGEEVRELLVIHPIESAWALYGNFTSPGDELDALDKEFTALQDALLGAHIDYDYGDEDILRRHGSVEKERRTPRLRIGEALYKAVLVPPLRTIRLSTLDLLAAFVHAGGTVVFLGHPPALVDGLPSDAGRELAQTCQRLRSYGAAIDALAPLCRTVSVTDSQGREIGSILALLRKDKDAHYLFLCNTGHVPGKAGAIHDERMARDRTAAFENVTIRLPFLSKGVPVEMDPESGAFVETRHTQGDDVAIHTGFAALQSRTYIIPSKNRLRAKPAPATRTIRSRALAPKAWQIRLTEPNVVMLDAPRYRIGGGAWQDAKEILRIDADVRDALGIPHRGGAMVQPWARTPPVTPKSVCVELEYAFAVRSVPTGSVDLALEVPASFSGTLNGQQLAMESVHGWWVDPSLQRIPLPPAMFKTGTNHLRLTCTYDECHSGLEIVYLLGHFGCSLKGTERTLTAPPTSLRIGDWTRQGLPFYSGSVGYATRFTPTFAEGERVVLAVPAYRGTAVRILVDGEETGVIAWEPNEMDITGHVRPGQSCEVVVEVLGHRRNSHGPFHGIEKWPTWTGPEQFRFKSEETWCDAPQLVPCGLMAEPKLLVRTSP